MKRFVSLSLIIALLFTFSPAAFAAPDKNLYADMSGGFNGTSTTLQDSAGANTGFEGGQSSNKATGSTQTTVAGDATRRKSADDKVFKMVIMADSAKNNSEYNYARGLKNTAVSGYGAGDKIYLRAQYYIPDTDDYGASMLSYSDSFRVRMRLTLGSDKITIADLKLADSSGGTIAVNGSADDAFKNKWKYNTWHTVEAIITLGSPAKMSVYFDREPLEYKTGGYSTDLTLATSALVPKDFDAIYANSARIATGDSVRRRLLYSDNWAYESYGADDTITLWTPPVYNPVAFASLTEGKKVDVADFDEVTVTTGDLSCDRVELYADGESVGSLSQAPYTFQIPDGFKTPGKKVTLKAVAFSDGDEYEKSVSIALTGSYHQSVMTELFENYTSFLEAQNGGWYNPSSRMHNAKAPGEWFIEPGTVEDQSGVSYGNCFKLGCAPGSEESWIDQGSQTQTNLKFGYQKLNGTSSYAVTGNKILLEWYMYLSNTNVDSLNLQFESSTICQWYADSAGIKWNVTPAATTNVIPKKWQHYSLLVDISGATPLVTLYVDGVLAFEKVSSTVSFNSFTKVVWNYEPNHELGSYLALDEIYLTHIVPRPSFDGAQFYIGGTASADAASVSADTNAIALAVDGGLLDTNLDSNVVLLENGKELRIVGSDGNVKKSTLMLSGSTLWLVPPRPLLKGADYAVRLKGTALFRDNAEIGYDQDFEFSTTYHSVDIKNVEFFKNGSKIDDPSSVSFSASDVLSAKVTAVNSSDSPLYLVFMAHNGTELSALKVSTIPAQSGEAEYETTEIIISDTADFGATVAVWNNDLQPISASAHIK